MDDFFPTIGGVVLFHFMVIGVCVAIGVAIKWVKGQ